MARLTPLLLAACILTCLPLVSELGDVFTGSQIDNKSQYFGYLGVRTPDLAEFRRTQFFVQATTLEPTDNSWMPTSSLLCHRSASPKHSVAGHSPLSPAPTFRRIEEQQLNSRNTITYQAGTYAQLDAFNRHEK